MMDVEGLDISLVKSHLQVVNYVLEKMVPDKPLEGGNSDGQFGLVPGVGQSQLVSLGHSSLRTGLRPWKKLKPSIEILCNNQVLSPDMSLATVRTYIWKKPEDLVLNYQTGFLKLYLLVLLCYAMLFLLLE